MTIHKTDPPKPFLSAGAIESALRPTSYTAFVLEMVLKDVAANLHCPVASGFEGPETYPNCGECVYCIAVKLSEKNKFEDR